MALYSYPEPRIRSAWLVGEPGFRREWIESGCRILLCEPGLEEKSKETFGLQETSGLKAFVGLNNHERHLVDPGNRPVPRHGDIPIAEEQTEGPTRLHLIHHLWGTGQCRA